MDWKMAEQVLWHMVDSYTQDNLRKITFNIEIFPLMLRFKADDRSEDLYNSIMETEKILLIDIYQ